MTKEDSFAQLEQDFQDVLAELSGDKALDHFRVEYEKIHTALKEANTSNQRLQVKCRELGAEIVANSGKVAQAIKLSQDDQMTIQQLKAELEKAWRMFDAAQDKECRAKEIIQSHKVEIENLTKLVEQSSVMVVGHGDSVNELLKAKQELTEERDQLLQETIKFREDLQKTDETNARLEDEYGDAVRTIAELKEDIQARQNEISREQRKKEKLEKEIKVYQSDSESRTAEVKTLQNSLSKRKDENTQLANQIRDTKVLAERAQKENELLATRLNKLQQEYQYQADHVDTLAADNQKKIAELKSRDDEINRLRSEMARLKKLREAVQRKLQSSEEARQDIEQKRDTLKGQMSSLEKYRENLIKQHETDKKQIGELIREREILNKNLLKAAAATQKQLSLVRLHEQGKKTLEQEIGAYREESGKQRKIIYQLEKERDKYINESCDLNTKMMNQAEEVKLSKSEIFEYKKKILEAETRLKQQQSLYEACRSDRNLYSKNLIEAQDETNEMKRKLKIMTHQIDQFKEEIAAKETALVKVNLEHTRIEKEKEALRGELQRMRQAGTESRQQLADMEKEIAKLQQVIREADTERKRQQKELEQVLTERDILGTQLVRRNDELALLYEKTKLQQSTLNKGEQHYRQRLEDIRVLKLEIRKFRREKRILLRSVASGEEVKKQVFQTQRELLHERTRCRALEEELENPMNIHRWRQLEGSDPSAYELIQKVQALQKRLISKTEEVVTKELTIQEKEKLYVELREILSRQPGPEAGEQMAEYQRSLRGKTKQLKRLAAELNMAEASVTEQECEISRLAKELQDCKQKYLSIKKKEQLRAERKVAEQTVIEPQRKDGPRFTGGGFNLKQATCIQAKI